MTGLLSICSQTCSMRVFLVDTRTSSPDPAVDPSAQPSDYRFIPVSRIQSFQILSLATTPEGSEPTFATAQPPLGPVDVKRLKDRESTRITQLKEQAADRGKGVSREAQAIYDALKRV